MIVKTTPDTSIIFTFALGYVVNFNDTIEVYFSHNVVIIIGFINLPFV